MPIGKGKIGAGRGRGGGSVGKPPLPQVSSPSSKATEAARKAAMKARVKKLARRRELEAKEVKRVDNLFGL